MDKLLFEFTHSMDEAIQQLIDKTGPSPASAIGFDLAIFNSSMSLFSQKMATEVTKLSLIFSKDPLPTTSEAETMLHDIDSAYVDLLATFYTLPKNQGESLYNMVHKAVLEVLSSVVGFIKSIGKTGVQAQKERLSLTALTWEACEAIERLPEHNLQAVCRIVKENEELVADALEEIEEEMKKCLIRDMAIDDDSMPWSNLDQMLLPPCVGLVKSARSFLKKINHVLQTQGMVDTPLQVRELDQVAVSVASLSPSVDDCISSIYPPLDRNQVQSNALHLLSLIENALKTVKESHYITDNDQLWIDFLFKAAYHNNSKLCTLLTPTE